MGCSSTYAARGSGAQWRALASRRDAGDDGDELIGMEPLPARPTRRAARVRADQRARGRHAARSIPAPPAAVAGGSRGGQTARGPLGLASPANRPVIDTVLDIIALAHAISLQPAAALASIGRYQLLPDAGRHFL